MKKALPVLGAILVLAILLHFAPKVTAVFLACGLYDVLRNRALSFGTVRRYFVGNGILTWLLSPFNTLLDILALPYINKGIYQLQDLPPAYQEEVKKLIDAAHKEDLVRQLEERTKEQARSMIFFKWYGANVDTFLNVPAFHEPYKYIQTIGVSVFNKRQSTSKHFGPFRATLRVLYNINNVESKDVYIEVGDVIHRWRDEKLFIFDDTLQHQSFNESDGVRYCLFVDIIRPTAWRAPFVLTIKFVRVFLRSVNRIFYKNWKVIEK
jgi:aspartyl/asparaginyl beta-hydroxylase (cupin superfamily)